MSQPDAASISFKKKNLWGVVLYASFIAATLDILAALLFFMIDTGKNPVIVLHFIASGLLGKAALSGSDSMAALGLVLHYIIAFIFTILFFMLYPKIKFFQKNRWVTAVVYGIFVWIIMNAVVLPLSNTPAMGFNLAKAIRAVIILICCIGLPLSFTASKYYVVKKI